MTQTYEEALRELIENMILNANLNEKERWVLYQRFGLFSEEAKSLEDVAIDYKVRFGVGPVTRERIRQYEARALRKIRESNQEDISRYDWLIDLLPYIKIMKALK